MSEAQQDTTIHDAVAAGVDPAYAEMLKRNEEAPEVEERVGRQYPRSDYMIGNLDDFGFKLAFDEKVPQTRLSFVVTDGPEGSVKIHYNGDLTLVVTKMTRDNKDAPLRARTPEEITEMEGNLIGLGKRLQRVLGLETPLPMSPTQAGVDKWLATAKAMKPQVVFAGYDKNGFATMSLYSLRAPSDPGKINKKLQPGKTALQVAHDQLDKEAQKAGKGPRVTLGMQQPVSY